VSSDNTYFDDLDGAITELVRLLRGPRLSELMASNVAVDIDRHLFPLLGLIVDRGPVRATELQALISVEQSTLSRQLATLAERGLIVRSADPADGRAVLLTAAPRARSAVLIVRRRWRRALADLMSDWSDAERDQLLRLTNRLVTNLERSL
jgi:DNA-binding MarR family transcriptional regulator